MIDEGYVKFNPNWDKSEIKVNTRLLEELNIYRTKLIGQNMIGKIPNGPGFGNISIKHTEGFLISGTNTGHLPLLQCSDMALVNKWDIAENTVWCKGETCASSETMSHAVIYDANPKVQAVIHIHHFTFWEKSLGKVPTTSTSNAYGTPELAMEISALVKATESPEGIINLAGHEEGILFYGKALPDTYALIQEWYEKLVR
jgi:hypothetical protein